MSEATKKYRKLALLFHILSLVATFGPLLFYGIVAFVQAQPAQKLTFALLSMVGIILAVVNVLFKYSFRSTIWLILLGIYICLDKITGMIIVIAICSILDEFCFTPLFKMYKNRAVINKQIDARIGDIK